MFLQPTNKRILTEFGNCALLVRCRSRYRTCATPGRHCFSECQPQHSQTMKIVDPLDGHSRWPHTTFMLPTNFDLSRVSLWYDKYCISSSIELRTMQSMIHRFCPACSSSLCSAHGPYSFWCIALSIAHHPSLRLYTASCLPPVHTYQGGS